MAKSLLHVPRERSTAREVLSWVFYQRCTTSGRPLVTMCVSSEVHVTPQTVLRAVNRSRGAFMGVLPEMQHKQLTTRDHLQVF